LARKKSPHPFIARIPLTFSLLLPLLIALLLFLLLSTASSAVFEFFLIHLTLVWGGLVDVWSSGASCRGRREREEGPLQEGRLKEQAVQEAQLSGVEQLQWEPLQEEAPLEAASLQEEAQHTP
jgi:hypothetical protein